MIRNVQSELYVVVSHSSKMKIDNFGSSLSQMSVFKVVILETYVTEPSKMYYSKLFNKKMRNCKKMGV